MRIGICASAEDAVLLKDLADYAELNLTKLANMSEEEFESTKKLLRENGVSAEVANTFFPGDMKLCGSEVNIDAIKKYTEKALERATELGIYTCVLGSGGARRIPDNMDFEQGMKQLDEVLGIIGECASKYGVTVAIEPLNKGETNCINSVSEGAAMIKRINHPNIKLLADIYHMGVENESMDAIAENKDSLCHVHIATPNGRAFPLKEEEYDYGAVKKALKDANYDLRISIEVRPTVDFVETAKKSITFLKKIFV